MDRTGKTMELTLPTAALHSAMDISDGVEDAVSCVSAQFSSCDHFGYFARSAAASLLSSDSSLVDFAPAMAVPL
eukprot:4314983-Amphidinium_carterae.1